MRGYAAWPGLLADCETLLLLRLFEVETILGGLGGRLGDGVRPLTVGVDGAGLVFCFSLTLLASPDFFSCGSWAACLSG